MHTNARETRFDCVLRHHSPYASCFHDFFAHLFVSVHVLVIHISPRTYLSSSFLMQQVASTRLKRRRVDEDDSDEEREGTQKKAKNALFGTSRAAAKGKASAAVQLAQRQEGKEEEEKEKEKEEANTKPKAKETVCSISLRDSALKWVSLHSLTVSSSLFCLCIFV